MRISVCTDMVFSDMPTHKAMEPCKRAGAGAIEFWGIGDKDIAAIAAASRDLELPVAAFCAPMSSPLVSDTGSASLAKALERAQKVCDALDCRNLIVTSGPPQAGLLPGAMRRNMRRALDLSAADLARRGMTLLLEPINVSEGQALNYSRDALALVRDAGSPHVKLLYDIYHMQLMEGNLIGTIMANMGHIAHMHAADVPGRTAPGQGEINFLRLAAAIRGAGYAGCVGLEYKPGADRQAELKEAIALLSGNS